MLTPFEGTAYHYTSLVTVVEMLRHSQIWLTSIRSMNDFGEWHYALHETIKFLKENGHDTMAQYLMRTAQYVFKQEKLHVDSIEAQYVFCLSQSSTDVSQWRLYADEANGVCIEFNVGQLCREDFSLRAYNVSYGIETVSDEILAFAQSQKTHSREDAELYTEEQLADIDQMFDARGLLYQTTFLKHESFRSEQEVRVIFCRSFGQYSDEDGDVYIDPKQNSMNTPAEFQVRRGQLVPFVKRSFAPSCIRRIICCGQSSDPDSIDALRHFLRASPNCGHIEIAAEPTLFR